MFWDNYCRISVWLICSLVGMEGQFCCSVVSEITVLLFCHIEWMKRKLWYLFKRVYFMLYWMSILLLFLINMKSKSLSFLFVSVSIVNCNFYYCCWTFRECFLYHFLGWCTYNHRHCWFVERFLVLHDKLCNCAWNSWVHCTTISFW